MKKAIRPLTRSFCKRTRDMLNDEKMPCYINIDFKDFEEKNKK